MTYLIVLHLLRIFKCSVLCRKPTIFFLECENMLISWHASSC